MRVLFSMLILMLMSFLSKGQEQEPKLFPDSVNFEIISPRMPKSNSLPLNNYLSAPVEPIPLPISNKLIFKKNNYLLDTIDSYNNRSLRRFRTGGLQILQSDKPFFFDTRFSFQEQFGWERFDIVLNGNASIHNRYNLATFESLLDPNNNRMLFWNASVEMDYQLNDQLYIFLKTRSSFIGKTYVGQEYQGGVKMKF